MNLQYNNINLSVNSSYLLCDSITLSESSQQKPIYTFLNKSIYDSVPTTLKNSISISYYMEPDNEPNYPIVTSIVDNTTIPQPSIINIGNIFITGYLNNYSLSLTPNSLIKASATFEIYYPFTGNLIPQLEADSLLYDVNNSSGVSHYWSAQLSSGTNPISNNNVLQLDYSASINLNPIYSIGNPYPVQIYIQNIQENITILSESQYNVKYSGQILDNLIPSLQNLQLNSISSLWSNTISDTVIIPLTGMQLEECKSNIGLDQNVFFTMSFARYN